MIDPYEQLSGAVGASAEWRRAAILATCTGICFLYAMTATVANVSLPQMQGTFSATQDQVAWVVTMNIVATAVVTPMSGWLVVRFGERRVILYCLIAFGLASLGCGVANSLSELVGYRILQGAFGAPLAPVTQTLVQASFPRHRHGPAIAIWGLGAVLGPVVAPTAGGYLSEIYNWRWVFYMILPFSVLAVVSAWIMIKDRARTVEAHLDWTGLLALAIAIMCLQLGLDRGERADWFQSSEIVAYAICGGFALYFFLAHILTSERPFLRPALFSDRNFALGMLLTLLFGMLNLTPMTLLPGMLKNVGGYPDTIIGYVLGLRGMGTAIAFLLMIYLSRFNPKILLICGFACQGVAGWQMAQLGANISLWDIAFPLWLQGFGVGLLWVPLTLISFATLKPEFMAEGSGIYHFLRNMGGSIHISLSIAVVLRMKQTSYADMTSQVTPFNEAFSLPWAVGGWSIETTKGMAAMTKEMTRQAIMVGYIDAFYFFVATVLLSVPLILFVRWNKPKS